jgi:hypothetical protein
LWTLGENPIFISFLEKTSNEVFYSIQKVPIKKETLLKKALIPCLKKDWKIGITYLHQNPEIGKTYEKEKKWLHLD